MTLRVLRRGCIPLSLLWFGMSATACGARQTTSKIPPRPQTQTKPTESDIAALRQRAEQGNPLAQYNLGISYYQGQGVIQDTVQALFWFRKAADQGQADAQWELGALYGKGDGVPQDFAQAVAWFRKAAEQGNADAQHDLGISYNHGQGVPQDFAQAAAWFRKAADQGQARAMALLGAMYGIGQGVPQDYVASHKWLNLAAARTTADKQKEYMDARDAIAESMTPQQLAEAQKRASDWLAEFQKRVKK